MSSRMVKSVFVEDAAQLLGISRRTVYYRIREGRLRTVRTPGGSQRVLLESIEAMLREGTGPLSAASTPASSGESVAE